MSRWDFKVCLFEGSALYYETVHSGFSSLQMELDAWRSRFHRRDPKLSKVDRIAVADLRPAIRRANDQAPVQDQTRVIRPQIEWLTTKAPRP